MVNGFHDAANSIATVVSTRVLSPRVAVLWAAFFNFAAMFVFAPKVANPALALAWHLRQVLRRLAENTVERGSSTRWILWLPWQSKHFAV